MKKFKTFETLPEYYEFFSQIPEDKWCVHDFKNNRGQMCAVGHLTNGRGDFVFRDFEFWHPVRDQINIDSKDVSAINNGNYDFEELGDTPKERVLNAIILLESGIMEEA